MVDKLTGLIAIFQRLEFDFRSNKAGSDDILGDAYEYLMYTIVVYSVLNCICNINFSFYLKNIIGVICADIEFITFKNNIFSHFS